MYGGLIAWPFERVDEILRGLPRAHRAGAAGAGRLAEPARAPAAPFVPERWHGERICGMAVCYSGDLVGADEALAPIRALGDPVVDLLGRAALHAGAVISSTTTEPKGNHYYWRTEFAGRAERRAARDLAASCSPSARSRTAQLGLAPPRRRAQRPRAGRRRGRQPRRALRDRRCNGMWEPGEPGAETFPEWIRDAWRAVRSVLDGRELHQLPDRRRGRVCGSETPTAPTSTGWSRVKRKYDPDNLFRSNRNVRP